MYYIVWSYKVSEANQSKFEEEYNRSGAWFKLFEPCGEYMGHELIKHTTDNSYLLIDKWMSKSTYDNFLKSHQLEYDDLNNRCKELYDEEVAVGTYDTL